MTASVAGLMILAIAVWAWRSYRRVPAIVYPAFLTFALVLFQGGLGGVAVVNELPPEVVTVHLGTALIILTLLALLTVTAFALTKTPPRVRLPRNFGRLALTASGVTLATMLLGSYVSGAGYGLACSGWPLCNGEVAPSTDATSVQLVFLHRVVAFALGLVLLALVWQAWRLRDAMPFALVAATGALAVYVLQALVGAANVWTRLADEVSAGHLALGTLLWLLLATLNIQLFRLYELLPYASKPSTKTDLAKAAR
jgi:heme A synthase